MLGASRHLGLEVQSSEGQSKGGEGPEWDPAGYLQLLNIQGTAHLSLQPRGPPHQASFTPVKHHLWDLLDLKIGRFPKETKLAEAQCLFPGLWLQLKIISPDAKIKLETGRKCSGFDASGS